VRILGMTITEKILARASNKTKVSPGDIIMAKIDVAMCNDIAAPDVISAFRAIADNVWDPQRVVFIMDHCVPAHNLWVATTARLVREFSKLQGLIFYELGRGGIEHQVMHEKGHVKPGEIIVGTDSRAYY